MLTQTVSHPTLSSTKMKGFEGSLYNKKSLCKQKK